jgi:hypothetical protein
MRHTLFRLFVVLTLISAAASVLFFAKLREEDAVMRAFLEDATRGVPRADPEALALAVARDVHRRTQGAVRAEDLPVYEQFESASLFHVSTGASIRFGMYGLTGQAKVGPCGTMTRVTLDALDRLRIPARKLQLLADEKQRVEGHTMLEFRSGDRWLVLSPSDDAFVWRTPDGRIATLDEIKADPAIFAQVFERFPGYPYRFDGTGHIRWAKLPAPVRGFFRLALGPKGYEEAQTPRLYDQPRLLLLLTALGLCTACAALAWWLQPPPKPAEKAAPVREQLA